MARLDRAQRGVRSLANGGYSSCTGGQDLSRVLFESGAGERGQRADIAATSPPTWTLERLAAEPPDRFFRGSFEEGGKRLVRAAEVARAVSSLGALRAALGRPIRSSPNSDERGETGPTPGNIPAGALGRLRTLALAEMFAVGAAVLLVETVEGLSESDDAAQRSESQAEDRLCDAVVRISASVLGTAADWRSFYQFEMRENLLRIFSVEDDSADVDGQSLGIREELDADVDTVLRFHLLRSFTRITGLELSASGRARVLRNDARRSTVSLTGSDVGGASDDVLRRGRASTMAAHNDSDSSLSIRPLGADDIEEQSVIRFVRSFRPGSSPDLRGAADAAQTERASVAALDFNLAGFCTHKNEKVYLQMAGGPEERTVALEWFRSSENARRGQPLGCFPIFGCYSVARGPSGLVLIPPGSGDPRMFRFPCSEDRERWLATIRTASRDSASSGSSSRVVQSDANDSESSEDDDDWVLLEGKDLTSPPQAPSESPGGVARLEWQWQKEKLRRFGNKLFASSSDQPR
jgi:hypothetical protein